MKMEVRRRKSGREEGKGAREGEGNTFITLKTKKSMDDP